MLKVSDGLLGLMVALLGVAIVWLAWGFPAMQHFQYGPGFFPSLIGGGLACAGLLLALRGWVSARGRDEERPSPLRLGAWARDPRLAGNAAAVVGGVIAYGLVVDWLGFLLTAFPLLFLLILQLGRRPRTALVVALIGTVATQQAFAELLLVPLPWGVLEPWSGALSWR